MPTGEGPDGVLAHVDFNVDPKRCSDGLMGSTSESHYPDEPINSWQALVQLGGNLLV